MIRLTVRQWLTLFAIVFACATRVEAQQSLDDFLNNLESKVKDLKSSYENRLNSPTSSCSPDDACDIESSSLSTNELFGSVRVDLSRNMIFEPNDSDGSSNGNQQTLDQARCAAETLVSSWESNIEEADTAIRWQYAADLEYGVWNMYPAFELEDCDTTTFDPRFRPWFASASGPKDVVIVIDSSGSMDSRDRMEMAKMAALLVLDTLTFADYVQVVDFDDDVYSADSTLISATSQNKARLASFIDDIVQGGGTDFDIALEHALDIFDASTQDSGCDEKLILFLSDGAGSGDISQLLEDAAQANIRIFSYGLGSGADSHTLQEMSCATSGIYYDVPESSALPTVMASYYTVLASGLSDVSTSRWSEPYTDVGGLGRMISLSVAGFVSSGGKKFAGVIAGDVTIDEITAATGESESAISNAVLARSQTCAPITLSEADLETLRGAYNCNPTPADWLRSLMDHSDALLVEVSQQFSTYFDSSQSCSDLVDACVADTSSGIDLETNNDFGGLQVDTSTQVVLVGGEGSIAGLAGSEFERVCAAKSLEELMAETLKNEETVAWQYIGDIEGSNTILPGLDYDCPSSYDPRDRPWFVVGSKPISDMVVVFDVTDEAITIAKHVLAQNTDADYVQAIRLTDLAMSDQLDDGRLHLASTSTLSDLTSFVDSSSGSTPGSGTISFFSSMSKAYQLLDESSDAGYSNSCDQIVVLITGQTHSDEIDLVDELEDIDDDIRVVTITIAASGTGDQPNMQKLACETNGYYDILTDTSESSLRQVALAPLRLLSAAMHLHTRWSAPYEDSLGLGRMTTISTPVFDMGGKGGGLSGVAGQDVLLSVLASQGGISESALVQEVNARAGVCYPLSSVSSLDRYRDAQHKCPASTLRHSLAVLLLVSCILLFV